MRKGLGSSDYGPTNINLNVVEYVNNIRAVNTWGYHNYP
jgi:hypothetical protein